MLEPIVRRLPLSFHTDEAPLPSSALRGRLSSWTRRPRILGITLGVLLLAALLALVWRKTHAPTGPGQRSAMAGQRANFANEPMPVATATVQTQDLHVFLDALGNVTPMQVVTVRSRVDGQLDKVLFREGQMVKEGDLLAQVDPRPYEVQLEQANGQLARDEALLQNAKVDLERYQTLLAQDSIAKQQVDAQASLVRQYEAALVADRGQVDSAKLQLTYTHITAPIAGRTGLRQVDPGNIIHASDTTGVVVITQLQPITVVFSIPEDDLRRVLREVRAGQTLQAEAFDRSGTTLLASGSLLTIDNQIDPTTGTVKLKAQFPNDDGALFPNQFVNVRLLVSVDKQVPTMPGAAIQHGTPGTYVFVVKDDNTVTIRPVKLGHAEGDRVAIRSGVEAGEVVVTDGTDKLREGSDVEVVSKDGGTVGAQPGKHHAGPGDPSRKGQHRKRRQE